MLEKGESVTDFKGGNGSNYVQQQGGPAAVYLYITTRCNLACLHCWVNAGSTKVGDRSLTLRDYQHLLTRLAKEGLKYVKITGGEPTLEEALLLGLLKSCRDLGLVACMESNGVLLDRVLLKRLKQEGLASLSISLDFPDAVSHDALRGKGGSFHAAVEAIRNAVAFGIDLVVVTTMFTGALNNLRELKRLVTFVLTELEAPCIKLSDVIPLGRAKNIGDATLSLQEQVELGNTLRELGKEFPGRITVGLPWSLVNPLDSPGLHFGSCGADQIMGILPDGSISLCGIGITRPDTIVGNVLDQDPLALWWDSDLFISVRTGWKQKKFSGVCGVCVFRRYCANVCPAYAFEVYGAFTAPYPTCQNLFEAGIFPKDYLVGEAMELGCQQC